MASKKEGLDFYGYCKANASGRRTNRLPAFCCKTLLIFSLAFCSLKASCRDIVFCGERIPVSNNFVREKLMNIIKRHVPYINMRQLRKRIEMNFPVVEYYLKATGLPEDFKYLPIVESGFLNVSSKVGARGFWQLMPPTAEEWGLAVTPTIDERDNIYKATHAACKVLASYYLKIKKDYGVSSWVLTAAAYNFGIGNISNAINKQGTDYFSMKLNDETAQYVYKIIAVKELFEYPELYINDFGYNVFNATNTTPPASIANASTDNSDFHSMVINVHEKDGQHPEEVSVADPNTIQQKVATESTTVDLNSSNKFTYLAATIKGRYNDFADGNLITIELLENLVLKRGFQRKGNQLKGKGWIIGERVFIDLGYGDHEVSVIDISGKKGVVPTSLKNNTPILLKITKNE